jgi:hypothetical protein
MASLDLLGQQPQPRFREGSGGPIWPARAHRRRAVNDAPNPGGCQPPGLNGLPIPDGQSSTDRAVNVTDDPNRKAGQVGPSLAVQPQDHPARERATSRALQEYLSQHARAEPVVLGRHGGSGTSAEADR